MLLLYLAEANAQFASASGLRRSACQTLMCLRPAKISLKNACPYLFGRIAASPPDALFAGEIC